jgi:Holliday junction resolvase RusA-like endonuclease
MQPGVAECLSFFVEGRPQTAGSKVAVPIVKGGERVATRVVESGDRKAKEAWREDLRAAARAAIQELGEDWRQDGAMVVEFTFYRRRPKSHFGTGRNVGVLKATADMFPTGRPDLLKVARAAEDALTAIVWHDDAQIVDERLRKEWAEREGCRVAVQRLAFPRAPQIA